MYSKEPPLAARSEPGVVVPFVQNPEPAQVGRRKGERGIFFSSLGHVGRPDVYRKDLTVWLFETVDPDHGSPAVRVADPHGRAQAWSVADVPGVGEVVGGAGLAGGGEPYLLIEVVEHARRPVLYHAAEDLVEDGGLVPSHRAPPGDPVVVDRLALAVAYLLYAFDGVRLAVDAAAGEGRVGGGHLQGTDADAQATYRRGRGAIDRTCDPQGPGGLRDVLQPCIHGDLDKDRVVRLGHCFGDRDLPTLHGAVVLDGVVLTLEADVEVVGDVDALG